jgi:hypothetical protein
MEVTMATPDGAVEQCALRLSYKVGYVATNSACLSAQAEQPGAFAFLPSSLCSGRF